ncbi:MAG: DUF1330 domain-containing protein [Quisquiliibacterium sp.]
MPAFLIADVEVTDPVLYEQYRAGVPATIAAYGGRYAARGGATEVLEGDWQPRRAVILEFPSLERLKAWYDSPEYKPLKEIRRKASNSRLVMVQGL